MRLEWCNSSQPAGGEALLWFRLSLTLVAKLCCAPPKTKWNKKCKLNKIHAAFGVLTDQEITLLSNAFAHQVACQTVRKCQNSRILRPFFVNGVHSMFDGSARKSKNKIKLFNSSYPEGNFWGNQLLNCSISFSSVYPRIAMSIHQSFPWLRPRRHSSKSIWTTENSKICCSKSLQK